MTDLAKLLNLLNDFGIEYKFDMITLDNSSMVILTAHTKKVGGYKFLVFIKEKVATKSSKEVKIWE